jgi:hypothetical protein
MLHFYSVQKRGSVFFRPKYFHEVHGFIFVIDAADSQRLDETAAVFADIVASDKVQVPILPNYSYNYNSKFVKNKSYQIFINIRKPFCSIGLK